MIERAVSVTPELLDALRRLIPQLTGRSPGPDVNELGLILGSGSSALLVARYPDAHGPIVGAGALGVYRVPTGVRAVIEDVVVDEGSRGLGLGEALMRGLLNLAKKLGARGVSLTSNSSRLAANRLYLRMGFGLRHTNCYYFDFR